MKNIYIAVKGSSPIKQILYILLFSVMVFVIGFDVLSGSIATAIQSPMVSVLFFISFSIIIFLFIIVFYNFLFVFFNESVLYTLILVYVQSSIIFSGIYFLIQAISISSLDVETPFKLSTEFVRVFTKDISILEQSFILYVDMMYFGFVTITTLGYGDIHPQTWYAKLMVIGHVVVGLYIFSVSLNRHFLRSERQE